MSGGWASAQLSFYSRFFVLALIGGVSRPDMEKIGVSDVHRSDRFRYTAVFEGEEILNRY